MVDSSTEPQQGPQQAQQPEGPAQPLVWMAEARRTSEEAAGKKSSPAPEAQQDTQDAINLTSEQDKSVEPSSPPANAESSQPVAAPVPVAAQEPGPCACAAALASAAAAVPADHSTELRSGVRAQVHSLVKAPKYNGWMVILRTYDLKAERWECVLDELGMPKEYLRLRPENLRYVDPATSRTRAARAAKETVSSLSAAINRPTTTDRDAARAANRNRGFTRGETITVPAEIISWPVAAPLPHMPWRIEVEGPRPAPNNMGNSDADGGGARWQSSVMRQVSIDRETTLGKIWGRVVQEVEHIAGEHVTNSYSRLRRHLLQVMSSPTTGDVSMVLALAGADIADHEPTMRQVKDLIRADLPDAHMALVGPEHLRTRVVATRHICEQLMCGSLGQSHVVPEDTKDAEDAEAEECEWPEDLDMRQVHRASAMDFADWHQERRKSGKTPGGVVLLVERADAAPKELLRDVLSCWGNTCCSLGIPMFVLLSLLHPPQSRDDLLPAELDPLVSVRCTDAICLFSARSVCASLLEWLAEDPSCLMVLPPRVLDWLRRDRFEYTRQSVSHVVKTLALLCIQFFNDNPFSALCGPLDDSAGVALVNPGRRQVEHIFEERLKAAGPEALERLRPLWSSELKTVAEHTTREQRTESLQAEAASKLAEAALWRRRLVASLQAWDELCCAVQPILRQQARLRRLNRLLSELWPQDCSTDPEALAQAAKEEQLRTDGLLAAVIGKVDGDGSPLSDDECSMLLDSLSSATDPLEKHLQKQFNDLRQPGLKISAIRAGLRDWFYQLRNACWLPLEGIARTLFLDCFCVKCPDAFAAQIESRLAGEKSLISESVLAPLTHTDITMVSAHSDCALLYRLFECATGKMIEVADLWDAFMSHASGDNLRHRFGQGLIALHFLGLHSQMQSSSAGPGVPFQGWRLRKRMFGRTWLKMKEEEDDDLDPAALWARAPVGNGDVAAIEAAPADESKADFSRPPMASTRRTPTFLPTPLKNSPFGQNRRHEEERQRLRRPGPEPIGAGRPEKKRRVRMFMA